MASETPIAEPFPRHRSLSEDLQRFLLVEENNRIEVGGENDDSTTTTANRDEARLGACQPAGRRICKSMTDAGCDNDDPLASHSSAPTPGMERLRGVHFRTHPVLKKDDIPERARRFSKVSDPEEMIRRCKASITEWSIRGDEEFQVQQIMAGLTNQLFKVCLLDPGMRNAQEPATVLFRIYGENCSDLYDPEIERWTFEELGKLGMAPKLIATFPESRIEEFIDGPVMERAELLTTTGLFSCARLLARFHGRAQEDTFFVRPLTGARDHTQAKIWQYINNWSGKCMPMLKDLGSSPGRLFGDEGRSPLASTQSPSCERLKMKVPLGTSSMGLLEYALKEGSVIQEMTLADVEDDECWYDICFCHNDVQENNILVANETSAILRLIDFEYSGLNYPAGDVASLFFEMTCDYCESNYPYFKIYPSDFARSETIDFFAAVYLSELHKRLILPCPENSEILQKFRTSIYRFMLANHLLWFFWSLIRAQQSTSTSSEFDYVEYARARLEMYRRLKKSVIAVGGVASKYCDEDHDDVPSVPQVCGNK